MIRRREGEKQNTIIINLTFTRSKFSDVTENLPLICTRLAFDLSSKDSLNPIGEKNQCHKICKPELTCSSSSNGSDNNYEDL
jgi:hypothetical protein